MLHTLQKVKFKNSMLHTIISLSLSLSLASCQPSIQRVEAAPPTDTVKTVAGVNTLKLIGKLDRFEKEIENFELSDNNNGFTTHGTLFVGSSSIRLWKNSTTLVPNSTSLNRGFGGATIAELNHYYPRIVQKYHPNNVIFYCGENDLAHNLASVDSVFSDFQKFATRLKKDNPNVKLFYLSIKNSPSRMAYATKFEEMNSKVKNWGQNDSNFIYIDFNTPLNNVHGLPDSSLFRKDMLHLNDTGYAHWEKALSPFLKRI